MAREIASPMAAIVQTMALLKSTTGLDLEQIVHRYAGGASTAGSGASSATPQLRG